MATIVTKNGVRNVKIKGADQVIFEDRNQWLRGNGDSTSVDQVRIYRWLGSDTGGMSLGWCVVAEPWDSDAFVVQFTEDYGDALARARQCLDLGSITNDEIDSALLIYWK